MMINWDFKKQEVAFPHLQHDFFVLKQIDALYSFELSSALYTYLYDGVFKWLLCTCAYHCSKRISAINRYHNIIPFYYTDTIFSIVITTTTKTSWSVMIYRD